jgi:hypothetical protein
MRNERKVLPKAPAGTIDIATDLLDDPELAELMGPPVEPDDGGGETDAQDQ